MKYRKITTILILSTALMGFFLTININFSTSELSISKVPDSSILNSKISGSMVLNPKTPNLPSLEVRENWITDASGNHVQLRGVAITEIQAIYEGHRSHARPTTFKDIIDLLDVYDFKVNTIRLTMHPLVDDETGLHGWTLDYNSKLKGDTHPLKMSHNDYFKLIIDPDVQYCVSKGYYVILDWHGISNWDYQSSMCLAETVEFWNYMCDKYANHPHVIFELWNEPAGDPNWLTWMPYAQGLIDAIRSGNWSQYQPLIDQVNNVKRPDIADRDICQIKYNTTNRANNIILVGGPSFNSILPHYLNSNWETEEYDASLFFTGGNIAYVIHIYPGHSLTSFLYTARFYPVVLTEWGYEALGPTPTAGHSGYAYNLKEHLQDWPNVGWIAWCFDYVYHPLMFDCKWNLLGNGLSDPTTRYHDTQCIYINTIPGVIDKQYKEGFETEPDTYDNYFGYFVKDWLEESEPAPIIRHTEDISIDVDSTGNSITWIAIDENPTTYIITRNGTQVDSDTWSSGNPITVNVDGLSPNIYIYTITVYDGDGLSKSDSVNLIVVPPAGGDVWFSSIYEQTVGDTFKTQIYVDTGSHNLGAYEFDIAYNENVIQIAKDGDIEPGYDGFVSVINISNVNGLVKISGFDEWGIGPSSQLHLLTITWTAVGAGISSLDLTIDTLVDKNGNIIDNPKDIDSSIVVEKAPEITPIIKPLSEFYYQEGTTGHSITWTATDDNPTTYTITQNGMIVASGTWSSDNPITINVDGLSAGAHQYNCTVNDGDGLYDWGTVNVIVSPINIGNLWFGTVSTQTIGDTFETKIYVNTGTQKLATYEFMISYIDILTGTTPVQIASNDDIKAGNEGFLSEVNIKNNESFVTIAGFNATGTGPSSQLHLLTITWTAVEAGTCLLRLSISSNKLLDTDLNTIGTPKGIPCRVIVENTPVQAPNLNSPSDIYYPENTTGHSITWTATDDNPTTYTVTEVTQDGTQLIAFGSWNSGDSIKVNLVGLSEGYHTYICTVNDGDGLSTMDSVRVRVYPAQAPILDSPLDINYKAGETGNSIIWTATDDNPTTYTIIRNGTQVNSGLWSSGNPIIINVDELSLGIYTFTCTVYDGDELIDSDSVNVLVYPATEPGGGEIPGYNLIIFLGSMGITILAMIYLKKIRQ